MKAYDYDAVTMDGAIYCTGCAPKETKATGSPHPIFADSEWDHYPVCDKCGAQHTYVSLTRDGVQYETEALRAKWRRLYDEHLGPVEEAMRDLAQDRKTGQEREKEALEGDRDDWKARAHILADLLEKRAGGRIMDLTSEEYDAVQGVV